MRWMGTTRTLPVLIFAAALSQFAARAQEPPPTRVAVVNFREALLATDEMQARLKELTTKYTPRQEEIARLAEELQELQQKLQSAQGAEALTMQSEFRRKHRNGQRLEEDYRADVEFDQSEVLDSGARTMREVVAELAATKGLDIRVDVTNTLCVKPALNLSAEATAAYNVKKQAQ